MDMAYAHVSNDEVDNLVSGLIDACGASGQTEVSFEQFKTLFASHMDALGDASLDWKGTGGLSYMNFISIFICIFVCICV